MVGDNTGDNISEKRLSFCEYTVMYWAWKNVKSDYYGLCHYRRYLSFLDYDIPGGALKQGLLDSMSHTTLKECGLLDEVNIRQQIEKADAVVPYEYHMLKDAMSNCHCNTIKENWIKHHAAFLTEAHFELMIQLIKDMSPDFYDDAVEYLNGVRFRGFNCFVMKKKLFNQMCEFMFPIMFKFDEIIDKSNFSSTQHRAVGYLGEWLFSIFIYHIQKIKTLKIQEHQIIAFQNTSKSVPLKPAFQKNNISVVFPANDTNRAMIGVMVQAILCHANPDYNYDLIILHRSYDEDKWGTHLRKEEDRSLHTMVADYKNVSLRLYDPKEELLSIEYHEWGTPSIEEFYYLLLCPWILENYNKIIYLQDPILIQHDISELFETDLDGSYAAAAKNLLFDAMLNGYAPGFRKLCNKELSMHDPYNYVSTDVVVMNLAQIRKDFTIQQVLSAQKKKKFKNLPADGFNVLFEEKMMFLPQRWNHLECCDPEFFALTEFIPAEEDSQRQNFICPFISNLRGIGGGFPPQQSHLVKTFWYYARKTPFYEELLLSMVPNWSFPIFDLQCRAGVFDQRTNMRKFADRLLPPGSHRRQFAKYIVPKGSLRWKVCKQIYYIFKPQYRPVKQRKQVEAGKRY